MSNKSLNNVFLIGNVGSNKFYDEKSGNPILIFDLATDRAWTQQSTGEKHESTSWHKIVAFGGLARVINDMINKGGRVFVSGRIDYEDKEGEKSAQIVAREIFVFDKGEDGEEGEGVAERVSGDEDMEIIIPNEIETEESEEEQG